MFTTSYPASFLPERNGKGLQVRFPDLPAALTGGDGFEDTLVQAADRLAESVAGRIARGDEIPPPATAKRGQLSSMSRSTLRQKWRCTLPCASAACQTPGLPSAHRGDV